MSYDINSISLTGYVGSEPKGNSDDTKKPYANVRLATNKSYMNAEGEQVSSTSWHNLVFFGKQALYVLDNVKKGHRLLALGELKCQKWQDKEGNDRFSTDIIVDKFEVYQLIFKDSDK